jgi:6-pyruvoyl-tetrahydropterin synthase
MTTLFVRKLTVIDCSYLDARRGLVGESWHVDVELDGDLNEQGMLFDFGHVKKTLKTYIDSTVDHALVIPTASDAYKLVSETDNKVALEFNSHIGKFKHTSPQCAIQRLEETEITAENVARWLEQTALSVLPDNVKAVRFHLHHEVMPTDQAYYHYSHGLKKHDGNCQRIAHGHRSLIEIFSNGQRNLTLENQWANQLHDGYIGTTEDIIAEDDTSMTFAYTANQGEFEITVPKGICTLMETDSTVELIAQFICGEIGVEGTKVVAYEGIEKGAVFSL